MKVTKNPFVGAFQTFPYSNIAQKTKPKMTFPIAQFKQTDTPFYYYDLPLLRSTLSRIKEIITPHPNYHVHYAVKANANKRILETIAEYGLGADCVSGGEVTLAHKSGFTNDKIVFAGVGKSDNEIRTALALGIHSFNVESIPELEVINELALEMHTTANVAFRVNPNVDAHTHAKITTGLNENKFGIDMDDLIGAIRKANYMREGVKFVGLHFHIGSQILDLEVYKHLCLRINELQDILEKEGIQAQSINVGGGLGINYANPDAEPIPDFESYFAIFTNHLKLRDNQELHFELGRSVVGQCGTLISRTLYVKDGHKKKFVIVDAGFTDLIRPAMYGAHHCTQNISADEQGGLETYDVVGPICESSDVFGMDEGLPHTKRGDFIAFRSAGAYGEVMASTYNCRKLPKAYYGE